MSESPSFTPLPPGEPLDVCTHTVGGSWGKKCCANFVSSALGSLLRFFFGGEMIDRCEDVGQMDRQKDRIRY